MAETELIWQLRAAVAGLDEPKMLQFIEKVVAHHPDLSSVAVQAIQDGMNEVGRLYQSGEYFLAEMVFAAEVIKKVMPRLTEILKEDSTKKLGVFVIGTVRGDIHDIGKGLVSGIMDAAGFDVVDLGVDVPPQRFVDAIREHNPKIVGLSGLLTLAIDPMKETVDAISEAGLRDQVKIIIGGNPITQNIHKMVGSDAYTDNAAEGVATCLKWTEV